MLKTIIIFTLILITILVLYNIIIHKYFSQNNTNISYHLLLNYFIHSVSKDNYFMNYGLWDDKNNTLLKANKNLIHFVFDKTQLANKKNMNILDVGCGYGEQDIEWTKQLDKSCKIKAVDISEEQIYSAMRKNSDVTFDICDAMFIDLKYKNELFDVIISLESAFHYSDRPKFFKNVNSLLKDDGKFVITDIMLHNNYEKNLTTNIFIKFFSDFLHIPNQNLITEYEWTNQLSEKMNIIEMYDITDKTFNPYYKHFMNNFIKNTNLPSCLSNMLESFFCSVQPFSYKVAICEKI